MDFACCFLFYRRYITREHLHVLCNCMVSWQDTSNMVMIAQQKYSWLVPGKHYIQSKDSKKIYKFAGLTEAKGLFQFEDIWGKIEELEIDHSDLKNFRVTDKLPAQKLPLEKLEKLDVGNSSYWLLEKEKAQVQAAVLDNFLEFLYLI